MSYWGRPGDFFKLTYSRVLGNEPPGNVGWMAIIGSVGWIVFVLYRHFRPATPLLALSPAGISYRANGIRKLLVPWHEIQGVDDYEADNNFAGVSQRVPDLTAVLVSKEFYERNILPQRSVWDTRDSNWDLSFRPKGPLVQIQLSGTWFSIDPRDIREPVEARWKAFRDTPPPSSSVPSVTPRAAPRGEPLVYGRWSIDGSLWQAVKFLVPLACIAAVLVWMGWSH